MSPRFRVEALAATHDRLSFSSGVEPLDRYLRELATHDIKRRISNCFVALDDAASFEGGARASLACFFPRRRPQLFGFLRAFRRLRAAQIAFSSDRGRELTASDLRAPPVLTVFERSGVISPGIRVSPEAGIK